MARIEPQLYQTLWQPTQVLVAQLVAELDVELAHPPVLRGQPAARREHLLKEADRLAAAPRPSVGAGGSGDSPPLLSLPRSLAPSFPSLYPSESRATLLSSPSARLPRTRGGLPPASLRQLASNGVQNCSLVERASCTPLST
eukprot:scaffold193060_cov27-Tisochrysis_lutea.AAC.1